MILNPSSKALSSSRMGPNLDTSDGAFIIGPTCYSDTSDAFCNEGSNMENLNERYCCTASSILYFVIVSLTF